MKRLRGVLPCIALLCRTARYRCWLCFGGKRTEDGFRLLSNSILENRKLINELKAGQRDLERRLWDLEGHTPQETLEKIRKEIESWSASVEELSA